MAFNDLQYLCVVGPYGDATRRVCRSVSHFARLSLVFASLASAFGDGTRRYVSREEYLPRDTSFAMKHSPNIRALILTSFDLSICEPSFLPLPFGEALLYHQVSSKTCSDLTFFFGFSFLFWPDLHRQVTVFVVIVPAVGPFRYSYLSPEAKLSLLRLSVPSHDIPNHLSYPSWDMENSMV